MNPNKTSEDFIKVLKNLEDVDIEISRCLLKLKNMETLYFDKADWSGAETRTEHAADFMIQKLKDTIELLEVAKSNLHDKF